MNRRSSLRLLWIGIASGLAGCVDRIIPGPDLVRCRGDPVSVDRTITDTPGYEDDIEYFPENGTVRFVATRNDKGPVSFGEWSFERWGALESAGVGLERVRETTATRLGTDEFGSGTAQPPGLFSSNSLVIWLFVSTQVEDGEPVRTPSVLLSQLADVAPRSADVTLSLEGDSYSRTVPVFAKHIEVGTQ